MENSKSSDKCSILLVALLLSLFLSISYARFGYGAGISSIAPYIDEYSTRIAKSSVNVNDTVGLSVGVYNPLNESADVSVRILVRDVECFPSNESTLLLSPKQVYATLSKAEFILVSSEAGIHPLEIQLWWNETKIDYRLLTLEALSPAPPLPSDIEIAFLRISMIVGGLIYLIVAVRFMNPTFQITSEGKNEKWSIFGWVSFFYWVAVLFVCWIASLEYDFTTYVVSSIGEPHHAILGIGWGLGIVTLGFCLFKKYEWSDRFSTFVFLFLMLSIAWDWLLFPEWPFSGWSPALLIVFTTLLQVVIELGIKGIFEGIKSKRHK